MPVSLQTRLLRVLEDRAIVRIGGYKPITVDVRVICTTHNDLDNRWWQVNIPRGCLPAGIIAFTASGNCATGGGYILLADRNCSNWRLLGWICCRIVAICADSACGDFSITTAGGKCPRAA